MVLFMRKSSLCVFGLSCLLAASVRAQLGVSPSQSAGMLRELREKAGDSRNEDPLGDERALLEQCRSLTSPQFLSGSLGGAARLQGDLTGYSSQYQEGRTFFSPWSGTVPEPGTSKDAKSMFVGMGLDQVFEWNEVRSGLGHQETYLSTTQLSISARYGTLETGRLSVNFAGGVTLAEGGDLFLQYGDGQRAWFIQPGSSLSYEVQFGPVTVMVYDRVSVRPESLVGWPIRLRSVTSSPFFGATQNDVGAAVTWKIRSDLTALLNYNWASSQEAHSLFDDSIDAWEPFEDRDIYSILASLTWDACKKVRLGILGGYSWSYFNGDFSADGEQWHTGLFSEMDLPWTHRLRLEAGMQGMTFGRLVPGTTIDFFSSTPDEVWINHGDNADLSSALYYKLALGGRLSERVVHELSLGREATLGLLSNYVESSFVNYGIQAGLWTGANLGVSGFYEIAQDSGGVFATDISSYGGVARLAQTIGKLTLSAGYGYTRFETDAQPYAPATFAMALDQQAMGASASYALCSNASINLSWQRFETQWKGVDTATQNRVMLGMRFVF